MPWDPACPSRRHLPPVRFVSSPSLNSNRKIYGSSSFLMGNFALIMLCKVMLWVFCPYSADGMNCGDHRHPSVCGINRTSRRSVHCGPSTVNWPSPSTINVKSLNMSYVPFSPALSWSFNVLGLNKYSYHLFDAKKFVATQNDTFSHNLFLVHFDLLFSVNGGSRVRRTKWGVNSKENVYRDFSNTLYSRLKIRLKWKSFSN